MSYVVNNKDFDTLEEFAVQGRGCATPTPNHYQVRRNDERIAKFRQFGIRADSLMIDVQFVHILSNGDGSISALQRADQIKVLNDCYADMGIIFQYDEGATIRVDNPAWFHMDTNSRAERQAKSALHRNPHITLNFYTARLADGLLGWATFPWELEGDEEMDGVVILDGSMPRGGEDRFNEGKTAVHEVGHWLGLYHTFQGGCEAYGDHVGDTAPHSSPNTGTPADGLPHNVCPGHGGFAPIHNYMNYVDDQWMTKFTDGQKDRAWNHISIYRDQLGAAK